MYPLVFVNVYSSGSICQCLGNQRDLQERTERNVSRSLWADTNPRNNSDLGESTILELRNSIWNLVRPAHIPRTVVSTAETRVNKREGERERERERESRKRSDENEMRANTDDDSVELGAGVRTTVMPREAKIGEK